MDNNTTPTKNRAAPGSAIVNAYTVIATLYCSVFSLLYYFVAGNTLLSVIHILAGLMVFMTCNYFMKQKIKDYESMLEERVRIQTAELAQKAAGLAASNAELEQFAYFASHDLQEPLNTTTAFVKLIRQRYEGRLDKEADQYFSFIVQASDRMKVLITELLEYAHIGRQKELERVDGNQLLADVLADLDHVIKTNSAIIKSDHLPVMKGYATELKLLFQNLISNAIKFRKKENFPEISIKVEKKESYWQFAFTDNGIGMDPQHHEKIFGLFKRLHTKDQYQGSGIGLAHCKKIVELHNGKIWVESAPGLGSTFYFTIREM